MTIEIIQVRPSGLQAHITTVRNWSDADAIARQTSLEPDATRVICIGGNTHHIYQHGKWIHGSSRWSVN